MCVDHHHINTQPAGTAHTHTVLTKVDLELHTHSLPLFIDLSLSLSAGIPSLLLLFLLFFITSCSRTWPLALTLLTFPWKPWPPFGPVTPVISERSGTSGRLRGVSPATHRPISYNQEFISDQKAANQSAAPRRAPPQRNVSTFLQMPRSAECDSEQRRLIHQTAELLSATATCGTACIRIHLFIFCVSSRSEGSICQADPHSPHQVHVETVRPSCPTGGVLQTAQNKWSQKM